MRLKINGVLVVEGTEVTVSDVADLVKVNEVYRFGKNLLDKHDDINTIVVERIVEDA